VDTPWLSEGRGILGRFLGGIFVRFLALSSHLSRRRLRHTIPKGPKVTGTTVVLSALAHVSDRAYVRQGGTLEHCGRQRFHSR
jgi:hypothetical protein